MIYMNIKKSQEMTTMRTNVASLVVAVTLGCLLIVQSTLVESVIVDGTRKGPSALKNQSSESELIDGYNTKTCGMSDEDTKKSGFVNSAKEGQFPWLASFQVKKNETYNHFCMGSFISDKWILSAAHCFADP